MKTIIKFSMLFCILFAFQHNLVAQSCQLGKQKSSFAYRSLYANPNASRNTTSTMTNHSTEPISLSTNLKNVEEITNRLKNLNWTYSTLYKNYSAVAYMLLEENSEYSNKVLDKINTVIKRILQNKLSKDLVEKEINNANKSGESVIQVFLAYY